MNYGIVMREGNTNADGVGIGGGVAAGPDESLGGSRLFGPDAVPGTDMVLGQLTDPEGHMIGLVQGGS